jgi:hypothetical protein
MAMSRSARVGARIGKDSIAFMAWLDRSLLRYCFFGTCLVVSAMVPLVLSASGRFESFKNSSETRRMKINHDLDSGLRKQ